VRAVVVVVVLLAALGLGGGAAGVGWAARASSSSSAAARGGRGDAAWTLPRVPSDRGLVGLVGGGFDALGTRLRLPDAVDLGATGTTGEPAGGAVPSSPTELAASGALAAAPAPDVAITPPPPSAFAATGNHAPVAAHPEPTRYPDVVPSGGTWALLIGINDYPGVQYDLRSAVNDAQDVDEALRRAGVTADRRMLLRDGDATSGKIRGGLDWLTAHAGSDATIVLFYAGHVQKLGERTEALVGSDGGAVVDTEVAELLDRSSAPRAWIGIAGCYGAGFDEVVRPGRILTAAAPAGSLAYESSSFGRSYLVEYMVHRAMLGEGITTVEGAFARAVDQLRAEHPDRVPVQDDDLDGDLDLRAAAGGGGGGSGPSPSTTTPPPAPPSSTPPPQDGCSRLTVGVARCGG
jgi:hypothetical protein